MLNIQRYKRTAHNFTVLAVKVEANNLEDVALWAGGIVGKTSELRPFISIATTVKGQTVHLKAYVGCWVVKSDHNIKVYTKDAFHKSFDLFDTIGANT